MSSTLARGVIRVLRARVPGRPEPELHRVQLGFRPATIDRMTTIGLTEHADQHDIEPRAFDFREMAEALDRNRDWIRRHMRELPHHRFPGNRVMFCDGCVRAYLRQTFVPPVLRRKRR